MIARGLRKLDQPVLLASGEYSADFVDGKAALAHGDDLGLACRAVLGVLAENGVDFEAVGGLTMGADQFAHGVAILGSKRWFVVRKVPKGRGTNKLVEGASLAPGIKVVLVDDVVTTGGSIQVAFEAVVKTGARVTAAVTLVDRGERAAGFFAERQIPYFRLLTYRDLDIDPVRGLVDA